MQNKYASKTSLLTFAAMVIAGLTLAGIAIFTLIQFSQMGR